VKDVRALAAVIGEEELTPLDKIYLEFGEKFERDFLSQGEYEDRSIEDTLDIGWKVISTLPKEELYRISEEEIAKYYGKD
jgi:V/A-type H+-transporting ATPase subunit B